jgi:hypothetical protein
VRYFYGFATQWSRKAREKQIVPGGPIRGLFTGDDKDQEPRFDYNKQQDIIFVEAPQPTLTPIRLHPAPAIAGQRVEILNHQFQRVAETGAVIDGWTVNLKAGIYQARVPGTTHEAVFDVVGEGAIDVCLG